MASFDSFNYEIERRMPEWWKGFGLLEPVNKYVQEIIISICIIHICTIYY